MKPERLFIRMPGSTFIRSKSRSGRMMSVWRRLTNVRSVTLSGRARRWRYTANAFLYSTTSRLSRDSAGSSAWSYARAYGLQNRYAAGQPAYLGDIVHFPYIQTAHPDVSIAFDIDPEQAKASRKRILAQAAQEKLLVAGMHFGGVVLRRSSLRARIPHRLY